MATAKKAPVKSNKAVTAKDVEQMPTIDQIKEVAVANATQDEPIAQPSTKTAKPQIDPDKTYKVFVSNSPYARPALRVLTGSRAQRLLDKGYIKIADIKGQE